MSSSLHLKRSFFLPLSTSHTESPSTSINTSTLTSKPLMASLFHFYLFTLSWVVSLSSSQILLPLTHSLSKSTATSTHHLLKLSTLTSTKRHHHHRHHKQQQKQPTQTQVSLPLSPGSDYILSISFGSKPAQTIQVYMDTGSDLVWFPCSPFECILCENKYEPSIPLTPFNLTSASPLPCSSPACSAAHSSLPSSNLCAISRCPLETIEISDCASFSCPPFYYAYGDGSLIARLYQDKLSIPLASSSLHLPKFNFGCAHTTLGEPIGVAGFGQGALSLPAQLSKHSPQLGNSFSYCLISHSFDSSRIHKPSPLILGRYSLKQKEAINGDTESDTSDGFLYTPILANPKHPYFYSVGLEAISIGKKRIPTTESMKRVNQEGDGGLVVDSGTTFTMLPTKLYNSVVREFESRLTPELTRASEVEQQAGLRPCYYYHNSAELARVPRLVLHFGGNSSVVLPRRNYFFSYVDGGDEGRKGKVACLMMMDGGDEAESGGPAGTLGNFQQQGFEVVYDLKSKRVGFARRQCATLWETLKQG